MKLTTIYDENVINQYMIDNDGMSATNMVIFASYNDLKAILGNPNYEDREDVFADVNVSWIVRVEETGKLFEIWIGDWGVHHNHYMINEQKCSWRISTDGAIHCGRECAMDKPAEELADYIESQIPMQQIVFVPNPVIGKRRYKCGVNGPFAVNVDSGMIVSDKPWIDRELYGEINSDSKLYKRFYSKLSPELQEEFNILIGETLAYIEEALFNMPEHANHTKIAMEKILSKYNQKIKDIEKSERKANKKK